MDTGGSGIFAFLSDPDSFPTIGTGEAGAGIVQAGVPPAKVIAFWRRAWPPRGDITATPLPGLEPMTAVMG